MNQQWGTAKQVNEALGFTSGSSAFRTLMYRHPELRDDIYRRHGDSLEWEYNVDAIAEWNTKRPGRGNRTPGWHGKTSTVSAEQPTEL